MNTKSQSFLNWVYGTIITAIAIGIFSSISGLNPFVLFWNLLVYIVLGIVIVVLLPGLIGFGLRYWPIQKMDDNYGQSDDHLPGIFHLLTALVAGYGVGLLWFKFIVKWCSVSPTLNTWAWDFIRFQSPNVEVYRLSAAWFWIPFVLSMICYGFADYLKES